MMTQNGTSKRSYPWTTTIKGQDVTLRLMTAADRERILSFARALPEDDLLFMSTDITKAEAVDFYIMSMQAGRIHAILAEWDGKIVGYCNLLINELTWTRHLGEIQLMIAPEYRGRGLGQVLAGEVFALAQEHGLQKVVARMAREQRGAIQVFEKMGFHAEALLADFVIDRRDRTHDLIVMTHDVTGLTE
jgi:RimJ/RimL family protein N-acetyltransferase